MDEQKKKQQWTAETRSDQQQVTQMHANSTTQDYWMKVQGQMVWGQSSNLNFFVAFLVDDRTMNNSQTKGIKLDKTHRSTCNLIPLDGAGVPNLSVRGITLILWRRWLSRSDYERTGRGALAITEPTPNGYWPCWWQDQPEHEVLFLQAIKEQDEGKTEYQSLMNWGSQWLSTGGRWAQLQHRMFAQWLNLSKKTQAKEGVQPLAK